MILKMKHYRFINQNEPKFLFSFVFCSNTVLNDFINKVLV